MARWAPAKQDTLDHLAAEITHNYSRGRVIVAVDGASVDGTSAFADDLAAALGRGRDDVVRVSADAVRETAGSALLVADGPFLARADLKGVWHFLVWVDVAGDRSASREASKITADALIDNTDAEHPRRVFADSC